MSPTISVIVPVYNVEKHIQRCAQNLFEQTLSDIEYIFVNDCGSDNSIQVLEQVILRYPERKNSIQLIHHSENKGLPSARNTGLSIATGTYILHCDSDDWMEQNALENMLEAITKQSADILWCDFFYSYPDRDKYVVQPSFNAKDDCIKALLSEKMHGAIWNKLVKRTLYTDHNIKFPDGISMWEDLRTTVQLFSYANRITYLNKAFYHYVQYNSNAMTQRNSEKKLSETFLNTEAIIAFLSARYPSKFDPYYNYLKFAAKQTLLFTSETRAFKQWRKIYPEANHCALSYSALPFRLRLLAWCATLGLWPIISSWVILKRVRNK